MAIKDQCINCKSFNGNVCLLTNVAPYYNQTSCERYTKRGIILDKGNSSSPITPQPTNNVATEPIFVKQGMFSQPFSFSGRIRRLEYFYIGYSGVYICSHDRIFCRCFRRWRRYNVLIPNPRILVYMGARGKTLSRQRKFGMVSAYSFLWVVDVIR